jgi:7-cyano-7-deazaguanine synthase
MTRSGSTGNDGPTATVTGVLFSAGLDSAVLAALEAGRGTVQPLYVSAGLSWEDAEQVLARTCLTALPFDTIRPLVVLRFPMEDVYPTTHWARVGAPPAYDTPDEDVYLIGRNVTLLSKAAVYAAQHRIGRLVLGPLAGNPFPDARPAFFDAMSRALSLGLDWPIDIDTPFAALHKDEVIRKGVELGVPLELTISCMKPVRSGPEGSAAAILHCGACSKCRERQQAFAAAGVPDPTFYVS